MVWKFLVWNWLLLAALAHPSLTQNNTCHRTETYNVTLYVPVMEPVTFRSFTWCIAVPPRCSKYTVQLRERLTFETEVRNRTVTECCKGYVQLYSNCVPECSNCSNMVCDSTRNCTCLPGYTGNQCNETCESGKWGERCEEVCICTAEEECHFDTGECTHRPPTTSTTPQITTDFVTATTFDIKLSPSSVWSDVTSAPDDYMETTQYFPYSADTMDWSQSTLRSTVSPTSHNPIIKKLSPAKSSATTMSTSSIVDDEFLDTKETDFSDDLQDNANNNFISDQDTDVVTFYNHITESTKHLTSTVHPDLTTTDLANRSRHIISAKLLNKIVNTTQSGVMVDIHSLKNITGLDIKFGDDKSLNVKENEFKRVSVNSSIIYAQWINEISANTSITIAAALVILIILLVIVVSATLIRCHHSEKKLPSNSKTTKKNDENSAINLVVRNSHYAVPGSPAFSFNNGYALDLTRELREANYDHPCSVRCLVDVNEHLYDELRY